MKLEDFMTNNSLEENSLVLELASDVKLDETAVKVLKNDPPEFIVPMTVMDINGCTNVKYKLVNGTALEYCMMPMTKAMFLNLYRNMLMPFMIGKNWFLNIHNYCVDPRCVYISKDYSEVFFLSLSDSAMVMSVTVYYETGTPTEVVRDDINTRVKKALDANGIEIPYNYITLVQKS